MRRFAQAQQIAVGNGFGVAQSIVSSGVAVSPIAIEFQDRHTDGHNQSN
jgi:hypothetical protein